MSKNTVSQNFAFYFSDTNAVLIKMVLSNQAILEELMKHYFWLNNEINDCSPAYSINARLEEGVVVPSGFYQGVVFSNNISVFENKVIYSYQNWLFIQYEMSDDYNLNITASYSKLHYSFFINILRKIFKKETCRIKNRQRRLFAHRMIFHFPIFYFLEKQKNFGVLHASAIEKNGEALIFTGFDGVGKSTLASYLCKHHGYKSLCDNFLLHNPEGYVLPFLEKIRVSQETADFLDIQANEKLYEKFESDVINPFKGNSPVKAKAIFWNTFGKKNKLDPLSAEELVRYSDCVADSVPEFIDYKQFCAVLRLISGDAKININRRLPQFLSTLDIYSLEKGKLESIALQAKMVVDCVG